MKRHIMRRASTKLFFGISILLFSSCAKKLTEVEAVKLPRVKEKVLMATLDSISLRKPEFLYSKLDSHFADGERDVNFKTSLRMKVDSAVNAIITYAKIPIITAMVTSDTVKISNKRDKCYIIENLGYFRNTFGIDFKYKNIEELLLGLPLDYNIDEKYFQIHDPYNYIVSSHRKRKIKRTEKGKTDEDILMKYYIHEDLKSIKRIEIESVEDSTHIDIHYLSRQEEKGYLIPKTMKVEIKTPKKIILIELEFDKAEINEPKELFIVIPESYGKCE